MPVALAVIAIPPVRHWAIKAVREGPVNWRLGAALYVLFFFGSTAGTQAMWVPSFITNPWPADVWPVLIPIILIERVVFSLIGAVVGLGVISALRRASFVKPKMAGY